MIPPLKEIRLRSISRWLTDQSPPTPAAEVPSRAESLDEQMLEAFEARTDSLMTAMMQAGTWGTQEGLQSFQTERLTMWQETVAEFLPLTTSPQSVD